MPERLIVLVSHERSGSHLLADLLVSTSEVVSLDEVCNFDAVDPDTSRASFFRFRHDYQQRNPNFALRPDAAAAQEFLDRYFAHLAGLSRAPRILVDVKYGHLHNFNPGWRSPEQAPFLMRYLESRKMSVVHLCRNDAIAAAISSMVAEKSRKWHRKTTEVERRPQKIRIPVTNVVHAALAREREKNRVSRWLVRTNCHQIIYEDLCHDDDQRQAAMTNLCGFLGLEHKRFTTNLVKVTPPVHELIENYSELRRVATMFGLHVGPAVAQNDQA